MTTPLRFTRRSRSTLGQLAGIAAVLAAGGCAYSSSETPRPLEPDYEQMAQRHASEPDGTAEDPAAADPALLDEDERAPSRTPSSSWGEGK